MAFEDFATHANIADKAYDRAVTGTSANELWDDGLGEHAPIGSLKANDFGLHDTIGNMGEWCLDQHDESFYESSPPTDPERSPVGSETRVNRGGSFGYTSVNARSANRLDNSPSNADYSIGLRPARAITD